ncbi:hypothetical protein ACIA5A_10165 [Micromonospora sp. NPDC051300]|uniref:hypothetical protein n=1 Tax=Micromonospora sp. NPDC051300 TaxID=3364286 RepID=UPI003797E3F6
MTRRRNTTGRRGAPAHSRNRKIAGGVALAVTAGAAFAVATGTGQAAENCAGLDNALRTNLTVLADQRRNPGAGSADRIADRTAVVDQIRRHRSAAGCAGTVEVAGAACPAVPWDQAMAVELDRAWAVTEQMAGERSGRLTDPRSTETRVQRLSAIVGGIRGIAQGAQRAQAGAPGTGNAGVTGAEAPAAGGAGRAVGIINAVGGLIGQIAGIVQAARAARQAKQPGGQQTDPGQDVPPGEAGQQNADPQAGTGNQNGANDQAGTGDQPGEAAAGEQAGDAGNRVAQRIRQIRARIQQLRALIQQIRAARQATRDQADGRDQTDPAERADGQDQTVPAGQPGAGNSEMTGQDQGTGPTRRATRSTQAQVYQVADPRIPGCAPVPR